MEVSAVGCLPHLPGKNLGPSECYESSTFIPVPENSTLYNCKKFPHKEKKDCNISSVACIPGVISGNDEPMKLNHVQHEDLVKCSSTECSENLLHENKHTEKIKEGNMLDMRIDSENVPSPIPIMAENVSRVNGICSEIDVAASSSLLTLEIPGTSSDASPSISNANDPSSNDSFGNDISIDESCISDVPQKRKRYLFLFRPSINKILVKNKTNNSYRCYVCGGIYRQKFSLKRHYLRSHVDFRYISEADIANCKIPVPSYHVEQHSNAENKKFTNGRKKFKKSSNDVFLENNDNCLMPGLYRCHDCSNVFCNTEAELKEHYNKHPDSVKKKFQCHICDASFFKKQILSRHLAGHGQKIIKTLCKRCNIEFLTKAEYQKHLASHSSGKKCKYCPKILSTSANRKRHEAVHEGLKTFRCAYCDSSFAQRKDLDRHLRKQHSELCHICSLCNKVFPSKDTLAVHTRVKHTGSPKSTENSSKPELSEKPVVLKPVVPKPTPIPAAKAKACLVCKRIFHTVYAMLKHKRNAHPFYRRKKRHKKSIKKQQAVKVSSSNFSEYQRSRIKSQKAAKDVGRPAKQNTRPGSRSLTKREKELTDERARLEERDFYNHVHENIAENLTNYIDGRSSQLSLKEYTFNDYLPDHFEERSHIPWSNFNFPHWYDVESAIKMKGHEIKRPENMSVEDALLYDATGLAPAPSSTTEDSQVESTLDEVNNISKLNGSQQCENLTSVEKGELIDKCVTSVILCYVCREKFHSYADFEEHYTNNHPNVEYSFVEIVGNKESPPVVPPELCSMNISSVGFRFSCDVPPQLSEYSMKCTKCFKQFEKGSELHEHVTVCGNLMTSSSGYVAPKPNPQRRIKRTMKKRMTLAQQQAALTANGFRTPEKRESASNTAPKSTEKGTKTEKLQFYKNGRLQTKSLTVDMNYFNTKPQKPVKSVSKRGRKSYAIVSSLYRNATAQPSTSSNIKPTSKRGRKSYAQMTTLFRSSKTMLASTSRECPDCGIIFLSLQSLTEHINNHCTRRCSLGEKERQMKLPKPVHNETKSNPYIENSSVFDSADTSMQHESDFTKDSSITNPVSSAKLTSHVADSSFPLDYSSKTGNKAMQFPNSHKQPSSDSEAAYTPIDLSKNSCDKGNLNSNLSGENQNNQCVTKSALEASLELVLNFVHSDEFKLSSKSIQNKLEQTTKTNSLASQIPKPVVVRRVGRPRKLKKPAVSPLLLQKGIASECVKRTIISKPARLEETIKKLTVRSKEKERQKSVTVANASEAENMHVFSSSNQVSDIPNTSLVQSDTNESNLVSQKEKSDILTVDNAIQQFILKNNASKLVDITIPDFSSKKDSNKNVDNLSAIPSDKNSNACAEQATPLKDVNNKSPTCDNITEKDSIGNEKDINDLTVVPEFSVAEPSDKLSPSTSSQGRSSPTFDSILQVINQKLHSEEQESSQLDSAISWLEDEKFEIPPSRTKLNIIVPRSNDEVLPANTENSATLTEVYVSKENHNLKPSMLPVNVPDLQEKPSQRVANSSPLENTELNKSLPTCSSKDVELAMEREIYPSPSEIKVPETQEVTAGSNLDLVNATGTEQAQQLAAKKIKSPVRSRSSVPSRKTSSPSSPVVRRGPGRPRRKLADAGAVIKIADAGAVIKIADADAVKKLADTNAVRKSADANAVKKSADAEAVKKSADADAVKKSADADAVKKSADADAVIKSGDADAKKSEDADAVKKSGDANAVSKSADTHAVKKSANAHAVRKSADAHAVKKSADADTVSADVDTVRKSADAHAVRKSAEADAVSKLTDANVVRKSDADAVSKSEDSDAFKKSADAHAVRKSADANGVRKSADAHAVRKSAGSGADKKSADAVAGRKSADAVAGRKSADADGARKSEDAAAARKSAVADAVRKSSGADAVRKSAGVDAVRKSVGADEVRKLADADEVRKLADADEVRKVADADEVRKVADADEVRKLADADEVRKLVGGDAVRKLVGSDAVRKLLDTDTIRKLADVNAVTHVNANETNVTPSKADINIPEKTSTENVSSQINITLNSSSNAAEGASSVDGQLTETKESSADVEHADMQTSDLPNVFESDKSNNLLENDSASSVSLRNFRTKSKTQNNTSMPNLTFPVSSNKTTEFGKNLASRMKEKMRSFDSSKSLVRIEEPNISTSAETSDTNSQASNEDNKIMKVVKKECGEVSDLTKIHSCPYCMLEFAYLTNFRRHIKKCQTRFENNETEPVPGTPSTHLQHLPKKDEVDYSILNLYRHQSRQTQMMKEVEHSKPIQKYECSVCHKIYLNLFSLMQHKTNHKLSAASSSGQSNDGPSCSEEADMENMLPFESGLIPDPLQEENESNYHESVEFNTMTENEVLENSEKASCDVSEPTSSEMAKVDTELDNDRNIIQWPHTNERNVENIESGIHAKKDFNQLLDLSSTPVKKENRDEKVKRKRGRPFGWRKSASIAQESEEGKKLKKDAKIIKNNEVIFKKKIGKLQSMDSENILCNKIRANARELILNTLAKPLRQKLKLMASAEEKHLNPVALNDQEKKSDATSFKNSLPIPKEMPIPIAKHLPVKVISDVEKLLPDSGNVKNISEIKSESLEKNELDNPSFTLTETTKSGKRRRRRQSVLPSKIPNKSESAQKRKPGRPPKSPLAIPSTSRSTKSSYSQSSGIRNIRKVLPILKMSDSSDSECGKVKPKLTAKKKVFKICALCKDKFISNLELHRHIQLVHSRRLQSPVSKLDSNKTIKKLSPKLSTVTSTENENNVSMKRGNSPLKKSSNLKICTICNKEFLTFLLLRNHQQNVHQKSLEPVTKFNQHPNQAKKSDFEVKPEQVMNKRSDAFTSKSSHLLTFTSADTSECDSDISAKRSISPQKKSPNLKVCALCKKRFLTGLVLRNHIQTVHSRKSDPVSIKPCVLEKRKDPAVKSIFLGKRTDIVPLKSGVLGRKTHSIAVRSGVFGKRTAPIPVSPDVLGRKSDPIAVKSDGLSRTTDLVMVKSNVLSRRSYPGAVKSELLAAASLKIKEGNASDRSALSRQCRKPLPPLKRYRMKKNPTEPLPKKPKL